MRVNRYLFTELVIATLTGLAVTFLPQRIGGQVGGLIPGAFGFLIGWIIAATVSEEIRRSRRLVTLRNSSRSVTRPNTSPSGRPLLRGRKVGSRIRDIIGHGSTDIGRA